MAKACVYLCHQWQDAEGFSEFCDYFTVQYAYIVPDTFADAHYVTVANQILADHM